MVFVFLLFRLDAQTPEPYRTVSRMLWVVADASRTAAAWSKTGVPTGEVREVTFGGARNRVATSWFGNVTADWMQPLGPGPLSGFLQRKGGGMFALLHRVDSPAALEAESARLQALGVTLLLRATLQVDGGVIRHVLFDTAAEGKYVLGLIVTPPAFEASVSRRRNVSQFAFLANDLERVSAYWARLGWPAMTYTRPDLSELVYRGQPGRFAMRLGWQRHGKVPYEWIQPLQGPSDYHEHLEKHGEGFHHLGFPVEDMDAAVREWEGWGFPMSMGGAWGVKGKLGSGRFVYHDLHAVASADMELLWSYRER